MIKSIQRPARIPVTAGSGPPALEAHSAVELKSKGKRHTWFLNGRHDSAANGRAHGH